MTKRIALIDGDVLVYQGGFASEQTYYDVLDSVTKEPICRFPNKKSANEWATFTCGPSPEMLFNEEDIEIVPYLKVEPLANALSNVKKIITSCLSKTKATGYKVFISGPTNFRLDIPYRQEYKGNRDKTHRPYWYKEIKDYIVKQHNGVVTEGEEADDALGIAQTKSSVICTIDKDLDMIPGWHYNLRDSRLYKVEDLEAFRWFYKQLLTGDGVDNILGCGIKESKVWLSGRNKGQQYESRVGVGPKEADELLQPCKSEKEMYTVVRNKYIESFKDDVDDLILKEARLLWIRRKANELWEPPV